VDVIGSKACSTAGAVADGRRIAQRIALLVPAAQSDGVVPGWLKTWFDATDGETWN
jgi:hypothetical protein